MDYKLEWSLRARADLQEIVSLIAAERPSAIAGWGEDLFRHVEILSSFPMIGPVIPEVSVRPTRRIVFGDYLIFYRVQQEPNVVELLTIWHGARGLPDFL